MFIILVKISIQLIHSSFGIISGSYYCTSVVGKSPENSHNRINILFYIYFTLTGQEQLFNLQNDHGELYDLVISKENEKLLTSWRKQMVAHLTERGENWVKDGKLVIQKESVQFGANHPKFKK